MQHLNILNILKRTVRAKVCPKCCQRPAGSESLGPDIARTCEEKCPVFVHLTQIADVVGKTSDDFLGSYEKQFRDVVCQQCHLSSDAGDYCSAWFSRECPLARQTSEVVNALEAVLRISSLKTSHD